MKIKICIEVYEMFSKIVYPNEANYVCRWVQKVNWCVIIFQLNAIAMSKIVQVWIGKIGAFIKIQ